MSEPKWRDKDVLYNLYHEEGLSQDQIGEKLGCSGTTVGKWMDKNNIETNDPDHLQIAHNARRNDVVDLHTKHDGYERFEDTFKGVSYRCYHHRLLAVAEYGIEPVKNKDVHHKNEIQWDNRPENLMLMKEKEHCELHANKRKRNNHGQFVGGN